jgi:uncharacterized protein
MNAFTQLALALALGSPAQTDSFTPPDDVTYRTADLLSEGTRITAQIFAPKGHENEKLPTIVLCHGWGGTADGLRPGCVAFAKAGYLAVAIDYRGWGASEGRLVRDTLGSEPRELREVVDPLDQTTDLMNAIHWVVAEPRCDPERIGLWGSSYSGGHVVYAAARDPRVKATVSQVPALDSRWVMLGPGRQQTLSEATARTRGEAGYPEKGAKVVGNLQGAPIRERMINYAPVDDVEKASKCAMLFILAGDEELFDNREHGIKAHERAKGPKKLVTIPGIKHYGIYNEARTEAQKLAIDWFAEHLKRGKSQ